MTSAAIPLRLTGDAANSELWETLVLPNMLIEALPAAIIVVDGEGHCRTLNAAAESLLHVGRKNLLGRRLSEVVSNDCPLFSLIEQCRLSRSAVSDAEMSIDGPRLHLEHVSVEVAPLDDPNGSVVVAMRDRSLEHRMARQSAAAEAAQSVRSMAGMLAHEIKNPLAGIRGAAQLLESKLGPSEGALAALIREESDRIVGLVNGVEIFADDRAPVLSIVNVHEALDHVCKLARVSFARHVTLREYYDPSLPSLRGNRDLLIQIFLNLVKNASEACDGSEGEIVVTTSYQAGFRIGERNKAHRQPRRIAVTIADNGPGVPDALAGNLFDPFVTSKPGGRGLGLPLVAKLVRAHDGMIEFQSKPGATRFTVLLPISDNQTEEGGS
ncbi:MAG TPA: ATP-binding protein [Dongiaceae bacterium]|jgi:two-component system nitrogen regulation sensor histidine kinase GlnL|nr:ATP-binding protein [Dongiaceae bacterium]